MNYSPWPDEGKTMQFTWRKAVWTLARPWYGANNVIYTLRDLTRLFPITFWFPFFTFRNKWLHIYFGWKPIAPHLDPAFYWRELAMIDMSGNTLYVQLSVRWGYGEPI